MNFQLMVHLVGGEICSKCDLRNEDDNLKTLVSVKEAEELSAKHFEILTVLENSSRSNINVSVLQAKKLQN